MTGPVDEELASQPACWRRAASTPVEGLPRPGARVAVIGCGTSWFVAMAYAAAREAAGEGWTDAFTASELPLARHYDTVLAISRSGTTTEVLDALGAASAVSRTVAVVGVPDTPIARAANAVVALDYADERSVVQTRFATTALALLRAQIGHDVERAACHAEQALKRSLPDEAMRADQVTYLGRGWTVGLAHEAALKVREAAQAWAESYPAMDYRHGPISIAEPGRLVWMFGRAPAGLPAEVKATGATWLSPEELDPMAALVLAQRVAVARARARGLDPDRPRHLARSVVLETP
jgi:fructoselysine-6-P-deglycase FrlB-like protein